MSAQADRAIAQFEGDHLHPRDGGLAQIGATAGCPNRGEQSAGTRCPCHISARSQSRIVSRHLSIVEPSSLLNDWAHGTRCRDCCLMGVKY